MMLEVRSLVKKFGAVTAVDSIDFSTGRYRCSGRQYTSIEAAYVWT